MSRAGTARRLLVPSFQRPSFVTSPRSALKAFRITATSMAS